MQPRIIPRRTLKIGRPGYRVTKQQDPYTGQKSLLFQVDYPEIEPGTTPRHRFMSCFEQKIEAPDKNYQYLLFAAEPYETIGFKVPNLEIDRNVEEGKFYTFRDKVNKSFVVCAVASQLAPAPL